MPRVIKYHPLVVIMQSLMALLIIIALIYV